jgi:hypothetical protein
MADRPVRILDSFYEHVFRGLPLGRGPNGEPSAYDFLDLDLPAIITHFTEHHDTLPRYLADHPGYKMLIGSGLTVYAYVAVSQLAPDGTVELIQIDIDPDWPDPTNDD